MQVERDCVLFDKAYEFHNHLFFECDFLANVWNSLLAKSGLVWSGRTWETWIVFVTYMNKGKSSFEKLIKLCFTYCVYSLWQERNLRIFRIMSTLLRSRKFLGY